MSPCWALLTAHAEAQPGLRSLGSSPAIDRCSVTDLGSGGPTTCVLHAPADWSAARLERDADAVALALYAVLSAACPVDLPAPDYLAAHRWRYARASVPLGRPCLWLEDLRVGLGGDWCPGGDAEGARASGLALADRILGA
jgi:predicted NAD/FAD-dependent oxidoreductase